MTKATFARWRACAALAGILAGSATIAASPTCKAAGNASQVADSWSTPRCFRLDAPDLNDKRISGGDWACKSDARVAADSGAWVELQVGYLSPRLQGDDPVRNAQARAFMNAMSFGFVPQSGDIPADATLYLRSENPVVGRLPLRAPRPGAMDIYGLSVDGLMMDDRGSAGFVIEAISPQGKTLRSWHLPRGSYQALYHLVRARRRAAAAATALDLKAFPTEVTGQLKKISGLGPVYPPASQARGHEAIVISQCQVQSNGRLSACTNLAVVGDLAFGASTLAYLAAAQFSVSSMDGPFPKKHVFRFTFALE